GGVPMGSLLRRLTYAYDLGSLKILISNYFTNESRIHYYRQIRERVSQVAPFLRLDNDPYITLIDGKLQWIIDAYTVSDRYPYSEPFAGNKGNFNYIRNSVKVLVDAYDGRMQFFVVDEDDPLIASYRQIFPQMFAASETVPPQVRQHFRYPLDFFQIQAQMYLSYHMSDAEVFYNQEDLWRLPTDIYEGNEQSMEPHYMIMRLPQGQTEEFILILPFTPGNKDNMIAWMAAHSSVDNYGKLLLYEFPKQQLVYGPKQVEARIDQNPQISQQLTLWSQQGSKVIRGDLLVIPIQESLLYVEPIYLRAEQGELPELKRVIVAYDEDIVMEESLEKALDTMFGRQKLQPLAPVPKTETKVPANLAQSALETYRKAQKAAQEGNWAAFGLYQQELEGILEQLNR
ncbi:MAG: COG1615 family transporter, partial [Symploca sp. SIO3E6]|nr:COG1615 family transporter [Caldora sp. SIO3E6]